MSKKRLTLKQALEIQERIYQEQKARIRKALSAEAEVWWCNDDDFIIDETDTHVRCEIKMN